MQKDILSLIEEGLVDSFNEKPEMITTTISRIFIFRSAGKVLKIYRRDNEYWNQSFCDLSRDDVRAKFICDDFEVNHAVNPNVYTALNGLIIIGRSVHFVNPKEKSEELVIVMNYIDANESFSDKLFLNTLNTQEYRSIGSQFANIKTGLTVHEQKVTDDWITLLEQRVLDAKIWMEHLIEYIPKETTHLYVEKINKYIASNKHRFAKIDASDLVYTIDTHGENALYDNKTIKFIDILLPASRWRWTPKEYDIYRLGADVLILTGGDNFKAYIEGAKEVYNNFDETDQNFYLLYCAGLMTCILATASQSDSKKTGLFRKYLIRFQEILEAFQP